MPQGNPLTEISKKPAGTHHTTSTTTTTATTHTTQFTHLVLPNVSQLLKPSSVCSVSDISTLSVTGSTDFLFLPHGTSAKFPSGLRPMSSASPKAASLVLYIPALHCILLFSLKIPQRISPAALLSTDFCFLVTGFLLSHFLSCTL